MNTEETADLLKLATASQDAGNYATAARQLNELIDREPSNAEARSRLGFVLTQLGNVDDAIAMHRRAAELVPQSASVWLNLGIALQQDDQRDDALSAFHQSIALDPTIAETYVSLGLEWHARGMTSKAIECQRNALQLKPNMVEAWCNLGILFQEVGFPSRWVPFQAALRLKPDDLATRSNQILYEQYSAEWSATELRNNAQATGVYFGKPIPLPVHDQWNPNQRRLRIGYVSSDFCAHPVGWMSLRSIVAHDRGSFEVHLYSDTKRSDSLMTRFEHGVEYWHDIRKLNNEALRNRILADGIDVLIDLNGHTVGNRLPIFAKRSAPVQLSWLGFCASTGIEAIDGVLIGNSQAPTGTQEAFTERVVTLPRCHFTYTPPDYAPDVSPPPSRNRDEITFGSFNYTAKIDHAVLQVWSKVLLATPNSRLVLKWRNLLDPEFASALRGKLVALGVESSRVVLRGASSHEQMLAEYADIDVALDPFPFSGGLTTCESLWMGVPVVTLPWQRPMSRQGLAILETIGCGELVAKNPREYIQIASKIATDRERLLELRLTMRERIRRSTLFDGESLARALEDCIREMYCRYRDDNSPSQ